MKFSLQAMLILASLILLASALPALAQCTDADSDGYFYELGCGTAQDCNDADANANPGIAADQCDGFDNDCDGFIDEDPACSGVLEAMAKGQQVALTPPNRSAWLPAIAWTGKDYGVFWEGNQTSTSRGYFVMLDINGNKLIEDTPLFNENFIIHYPDLVWTGKEFGMVWRDQRDSDGSSREIYFTILDAQGERVVGDVRISDQTGYPRDPQIVWNGHEYGVFWRDNRLVADDYLTCFRPVSAGGVPGTEVMLDIGNPLGHSISTLTVRAVWDGEFYGIVVSTLDHDDGTYNHYFALYDPSGSQESQTMIEGNLGLGDSNGDIALTWDGTNWGYWWNYLGQVHLTLLWEDGSFVNPGGNKHLQVTNVSAHAYVNRAVWNGDEYGLLYRPQSSDYQLRFSRVGADGTLLDEAVKLSTWSENVQGIASMAWNGSGFGLIWHDRLISLFQLVFNNVGNDYDLDGRAGRRDCDDGDDHVWALPGAVGNLTFAADTQTLDWDTPQQAGTDLDLTYDVLRSENAADFLAAVCVESGISGLSADDSAEPLAGAVYHYLVRANNGCGEGSLGNGAGGVPRDGSGCP